MMLAAPSSAMYSALLGGKTKGDDMARPPVSEQVQVNFRMPVDLRDRIKRRAEAEGTSMNAEIVDALERMFPRPRDVSDVIAEVASVLGNVEPELRERAIAALKERAESGALSSRAEAAAYAEREIFNRFPWEE